MADCREIVLRRPLDYGSVVTSERSGIWVRFSPPESRFCIFIFLSLISLCLIAIGFDPRVFHVVFTRGGALAATIRSHGRVSVQDNRCGFGQS
jgi:hypothetical protein